MCRHLGYLGPARPISDVITGGTHSLFRQSWAPRDMRRGGTVNADGFGVSWWNSDHIRRGYRGAEPIWADPAVTEVLGEISSTAVLAAVRSATEGMPLGRSATAPFGDGRWALSLNGRVIDWRPVLGELMGDIPAADLLALPAPTDAAALWLLVRHRVSTVDPVAVLAEIAGRVLASPDPRLNLLLGNGDTLWATAVHHSLWFCDRPDSVIVSSEPIDDGDDWAPIPDRSVVVAKPGQVTITALPGGDS